MRHDSRLTFTSATTIVVLAVMATAQSSAGQLARTLPAASVSAQEPAAKIPDGLPDWAVGMNPQAAALVTLSMYTKGEASVDQMRPFVEWVMNGYKSGETTLEDVVTLLKPVVIKINRAAFSTKGLFEGMESYTRVRIGALTPKSGSGPGGLVTFDSSPESFTVFRSLYFKEGILISEKDLPPEARGMLSK